MITWSSTERQQAFEAWFHPVALTHGLDATTLRPASADASFRRYLRVDVVRRADAKRSPHGDSLIVMDAPPPMEDVRPFVDMASRIQAAGLLGPEVLEAQVPEGFLLLSDLGSTLLLQTLQEAERRGDTQASDTLMRSVVAALVQWQQGVSGAGLARFDEAMLQREMQLFPDWCVQREFGIEWSDKEQQVWQQITRRLSDRALAQATVTVHRDWMPRNLMLNSTGQGPGVLDFQDAVVGPISYDVASMLRDAFLSWDEAREIDWAARYWQQARAARLPVPDDFAHFWQDVEWMGLQRHLKVLGIFCRLKHRDGKPKYAQDLPRFFAYATRVAQRYGALKPLLALIEPMSGMQAQTAYSMR